MALTLAEEVKNFSRDWRAVYTVPESPMIKLMCKSVQQSGHVPAAPQMASVALTHELSFTSTTVSQQPVFPLFLKGNGPRIRADRLQWATLSLDPPGKHTAASVMHVHVSQAVQRSSKQRPLSAGYLYSRRWWTPPTSAINAAYSHTAEIITSSTIKGIINEKQTNQPPTRATNKQPREEQRADRTLMCPQMIQWKQQDFKKVPYSPSTFLFGLNDKHIQ